MNKEIMKAMGFGEQVESVEAGLCPFCKKKPGPFRDSLSSKEHSISGLCQKCQDKVFGAPVSKKKKKG